MSEFLTPMQIVKEAESAYKVSDFSIAARHFEAARQGYLSANDSLMAAELANNCSVALLQSGDNEAALAVLDGAEAVFVAAKDRKRQAMTLGNKAAVLEALDRLAEAEETYWKAAKIFDEIGEIELRIPLMRSISALQLRTGRYFQAVASMYSGVENIEKPTFKQRFLKRLLGIPIQILNNQSIELPDGTNEN